MSDTTVLSAFEIERAQHVATNESVAGQVIIAVVQNGVHKQMNKAEFNLWNASGGGGVTSFNTRTGAVVLTAADILAIMKACPSYQSGLDGYQALMITPAGTLDVAVVIPNN